MDQSHTVRSTCSRARHDYFRSIRLHSTTESQEPSHIIHHVYTLQESEPRTKTDYLENKKKVISSALSNWLIYTILCKMIYVINSISLCMKKLEICHILYSGIVTEDALY